MTLHEHLTLLTANPFGWVALVIAALLPLAFAIHLYEHRSPKGPACDHETLIDPACRNRECIRVCLYS